MAKTRKPTPPIAFPPERRGMVPGQGKVPKRPPRPTHKPKTAPQRPEGSTSS